MCPVFSWDICFGYVFFFFFFLMAAEDVEYQPLSCFGFLENKVETKGILSCGILNPSLFTDWSILKMRTFSVSHGRVQWVLCIKAVNVLHSLVPGLSFYELILSGSVSFGIVSCLTGFQIWWWSPWVLSLFQLWVFLLLEEKTSCDWKDWNYTQCNSLIHKFIRELLLLVSGWKKPDCKLLKELGSMLFVYFKS